MLLKVTGRVKKNISIIAIFILAVVCCACFDMSFDSFDSGEDIKGSSFFSISYSLVAFAPSDVSKTNIEADNQGQSIDQIDPSTVIYSRIIRKLLAVTGGLTPAGSPSHFKCYFLSLCAAGWAYLFLLTHISFFHLKDGSK